MHRKLPIKRIIAVLSVTLIYCLCGVVVKCQDFVHTGLQSMPESEETSEITYNSDNDDSIAEGTVGWWKAGINEYRIIEEIMSETIETTQETTEQTTEKPKVTTAVTTETQATTTETEKPEEETTVTSEAVTETTTESADIPAHDLTGDTLKVYNIYSGEYVEGNAYDILCQVVYNEVGSSFNEEAIKAQAVASYSFIKYYNQRGKYADVALKSNPPSKVKNCVSSVAGIACYYNGGYALTTYFASSAGYTISAKDVYGTNYPYLVSVESKYDNLDPNYGRTMTLSESEVRSYIENNTNISLSSDPSNWFTFLDASSGGVLSGSMVGKMLIDGNSSCYVNGINCTITGRVLREKIFNYKLRSACFDIKYSNGTFTFTTYGYGHGVGMSQHGANLYASYEGMTYIDILQHYFQGVTIN